jgi:hypothetical protein
MVLEAQYAEATINAIEDVVQLVRGSPPTAGRDSVDESKGVG